MAQEEVPGVDKKSGSAEQVVNDGQRCAVSGDTSTTEDVSQVKEAESEVTRCADLQYCTVSFCVMFDTVRQV